MEVWVRSQDKEILANVKSVRFCRMKKCDLKAEPNTMAEFIASSDAYCVECNGEFFGEYPTKERCLEIIDEIQKLLGLGNPENAFMHIHNYEMPYDEILELFNRVRQDKAIVTRGAEFEVVMPSVITYEMPKE